MNIKLYTKDGLEINTKQELRNEMSRLYGTNSWIVNLYINNIEYTIIKPWNKRCFCVYSLDTFENVVTEINKQHKIICSKSTKYRSFYRKGLVHVGNISVNLDSSNNKIIERLKIKWKILQN